MWPKEAYGPTHKKQRFVTYWLLLAVVTSYAREETADSVYRLDTSPRNGRQKDAVQELTKRFKEMAGFV